MALVTTCATTPLTRLLYPEWYQTKLQLWKQGKIDWDGNLIAQDHTSNDHDHDDKADGDIVRKMLVYLRLDALPGLFTFISMMGDKNSADIIGSETMQTENHNEYSSALARRRNALEVHGLRLVELTDRESSVMQVSEIQEYGNHDPVVKTFRTFCQFQDVAVAGSLAVVPERSYAETLLGRAQDISSDLILIPWSETGSMSEQNPLPPFSVNSRTYHSLTGPYASFISALFPAASNASSSSLQASSSSAQISSLPSTASNIAILIDRGFSGHPASSHSTTNMLDQGTKSGGTVAEEKLQVIPPTLQRLNTGLSIHNEIEKPSLSALQAHHLIVPLFSPNNSPDDTFAFNFAIQLASKNPSTKCTILHFDLDANGSDNLDSNIPKEFINDHRLTYRSITGLSSLEGPSLISSILSSITDTISSGNGQNNSPSSSSYSDLLILPRRPSARLSFVETANTTGEETIMTRSLGPVATRLLSGDGYGGSVLVVQAADPHPVRSEAIKKLDDDDED